MLAGSKEERKWKKTEGHSLPKIGSISSQHSALFRRHFELLFLLIDKQEELVLNQAKLD
jgi:hypothetical protein